MVTKIKKGTKKEEFDQKLARMKANGNFDAQRFCGIVKLKEDPRVLQKKMRNEWE